MKKKVRFCDIAEIAGLSTATVSHIFNGNTERHRISESTRKKVLDIAKRFEDQVHIQRAIVKATRTKTIGVIVPDMSNFSFSMFLHKLESIARQHQIQLIISCSHFDKHQEIISINNLLERNVDGIITITSLDSDNIYNNINSSTPVLLYDRFIFKSQLPFVTSESIQSVSELISEKANNFNEFYFLGADINISAIRERLIGFKKGLRTAGLKLKPEWIVHDKYQENLGYILIDRLVKHINRLPEAIFTPSGNLLEGVLLFLKENRVPQGDIYLCSYDHNLYHNFLYYDVDILAQNYDLLAAHCFFNIQRLIDKKSLQTKLIKIKPKRLSSQISCS